MTPQEIQTIKDRLANFALSAQDTAPDTILASDGGPSAALMAYRAKHNLSLDWMIEGEGPQHRKGTSPKSLVDIEEDATFLHGLLQGLHLLIAEADSQASPASNSSYALSSEVVEKANRLVNDLSPHADAEHRSRASKRQSDVHTLFDQWKGVRAQKAALVTLNNGDDPNTRDFKELGAQEERLATEIAAAKPSSQADCATMLEWTQADGEGAIWCDLYEQVRASVVAFLRAEKAHA